MVVPTTLDKNLYKKLEPSKAVDMTDIEEDDEIIDDVQKILDETPRRRGRPKKQLSINDDEPIEEVKPKRRGRPRKNPIIEEDNDTNEEEMQELEDNTSLPGLLAEDNKANININDDNYEENNDSNFLPGFEGDDEENELEEEKINILPGFEEEDIENSNNSISDVQNEDDLEEINNPTFFDDEEDFNSNQYLEEDYNMNNSELYNNRNYETSMKTYDNIFDDEEFEGLLSKEKKIVSFVGTSKNGTSFMVNNLAIILSNMGINTAILDATSNKNAYYIYTQNYEELRKTALESFDNLKNNNAEGIKVNSNLSVYTTVPNKNEEIKDSRPILETLIKNHSLVLIDCDFSTPIEYFDKSQELYLVQTMDVLTIQPLTEFLRELKVKNVLDERKIRIVLNKVLRVKGASAKNIIGGMSNYNDPEMSFLTELFNRNTVKLSAQIPFDEDVYIKYLGSLIECEIQVNSYPKEFRQRLNSLAEQIYPLLPGKKSDNKKGKKDTKGYSNTFSDGMNSTLDSMRKKY